MIKKFKTRMTCPAITKNSNWEILTKNLVLKNKMGEGWKNFNIFGIHWKIRVLDGWFTKNQHSQVS